MLQQRVCLDTTNKKATKEDQRANIYIYIYIYVKGIQQFSRPDLSIKTLSLPLIYISRH